MKLTAFAPGLIIDGRGVIAVPGTNFGDLPEAVHLRATRKSTLGNEHTFRGQQFIGQRAIVRVTNYRRTRSVGGHVSYKEKWEILCEMIKMCS